MITTQQLWLICSVKMIQAISQGKPVGTRRSLSGPRPKDRWKTLLLHKLHKSSDEKIVINSCLIDKEHYLMSLSA